jgi:hypothetical protein
LGNADDDDAFTVQENVLGSGNKGLVKKLIHRHKFTLTSDYSRVMVFCNRVSRRPVLFAQRSAPTSPYAAWVFVTELGIIEGAESDTFNFFNLRYTHSSVINSTNSLNKEGVLLGGLITEIDDFIGWAPGLKLLSGEGYNQRLVNVPSQQGVQAFLPSDVTTMYPMDDEVGDVYTENKYNVDYAVYTGGTSLLTGTYTTALASPHKLFHTWYGVAGSPASGLFGGTGGTQWPRAVPATFGNPKIVFIGSMRYIGATYARVELTVYYSYDSNAGYNSVTENVFLSNSDVIDMNATIPNMRDFLPDSHRQAPILGFELNVFFTGTVTSIHADSNLDINIEIPDHYARSTFFTALIAERETSDQSLLFTTESKVELTLKPSVSSELGHNYSTLSPISSAERDHFRDAVKAMLLSGVPLVRPGPFSIYSVVHPQYERAVTNSMPAYHAGGFFNTIKKIGRKMFGMAKMFKTPISEALTMTGNPLAATAVNTMLSSGDSKSSYRCAGEALKPQTRENAKKSITFNNPLGEDGTTGTQYYETFLSRFCLDCREEDSDCCSHLLDAPFQYWCCNICRRLLLCDGNELTQHVLGHNSLFKGVYCDKCAMWMVDTDEHSSECTAGKARCGQCGFYAHIATIHEHLAEEHGYNGTPICCEHCNLVFTTMGRLKRHLVLGRHSRYIECLDCEAHFNPSLASRAKTIVVNTNKHCNLPHHFVDDEIYECSGKMVNFSDITPNDVEYYDRPVPEKKVKTHTRPTTLDRDWETK